MDQIFGISRHRPLGSITAERYQFVKSPRQPVRMFERVSVDEKHLPEEVAVHSGGSRALYTGTDYLLAPDGLVPQPGYESAMEDL